MSLLSFTVYRVLHRLPLLHVCHVLKAHSIITASPLDQGAWGDPGTCSKQPSHYPGGPSAQSAWLTAWLSAFCMKLELKHDSGCLLAFCCAHDTARISFSVLMPSLLTTLITKLGGATTSLLRTCTADNLPSLQESGVQTKLILGLFNYSSRVVKQLLRDCSEVHVDSCMCKGVQQDMPTMS